MKSPILYFSEFNMVEYLTGILSLYCIHFSFRHIKTAFSQCLLYDAYEANQFMKKS